jgi:hypothetical protein
MRFDGEINIAMELTSPGLKKIERTVTIALVKWISLRDGVVVHIRSMGKLDSRPAPFKKAEKARGNHR